jgi:tetratricopeptide (TPR) repeat protein
MTSSRHSCIRSLLGASYLLRGDNHVHGSRVTLRAELASLESGEVLWAGSGTAEIAALFAGEDDLVPAIVAQVSQHVHAWELSRTRSLLMSTLASYTLYLGASGLLNSLAPADFARAREVLDHLVDRHPRQAAPHAMLAHWHLFRIAQGWAADRGQESGLARAHLSRALELDADLPEAHVSASVYTDMIADDPAGTLKHVDSALAVNPGHAHAWIMRSSAQVTLGDHEAGLHSARHAIALSPLDPRRYYFESFAARAAFACRRHADAVQLARASVRRNLHHAPSHRMLVGARWEEGQHEAARSAARLYVELFPSATAGGSVDPESSPRRTGRFVEALRAAGVPG